jgi:uncharacterized protein (DUF4415 family)
MSKANDVTFDDDNPERTAKDFARAGLGDEMLAHIRPAFSKTRRRPPGSAKQLASLRIDRDTPDRFHATGPDWQTRINEALRKAVG